tara:strand:+ start:768 stop:1538 length:771 start_codon:yes stop_codon:yes gene_type:complete
MKSVIKILAVSFTISIITACAHQPETLYSPEFKNIEAFSAQMSKDLQAGAEKLVGHSMYSKSEYNPKTGLLHFTTEIVPRDGFSAIYNSYNNYCVGKGGVFDGGRYGTNLCIDADTGTPLFFVYFRKQEGFDYAGGDNYLITADEATNETNGYKLLDIAKSAGFKTTREREIDAQWEEIGKHTAKANLLYFQENATVGTQVFCGMIINTRGTLVEVQTISRATAWVPRESLKQPKEFSDRSIELGFCEGYLTHFKK